MKCSGKRTASGVSTLIAVTLLAFPSAAFATGGTAVFGPGPLTMDAPTTVAFLGTLNGHDQVLSAPQGIVVTNLVGGTFEWDITLTTTQFATTAGSTLPVTAVTDTGFTGVCQSSDPTDCLLVGDSTGVVAIPAATVAPTAVTIETAADDTGLGGPMLYTHVMNLAVSANAVAGNYLSTWTYSIITAP
jgi:hypothetical protein